MPYAAINGWPTRVSRHLHALKIIQHKPCSAPSKKALHGLELL